MRKVIVPLVAAMAVVFIGLGSDSGIESVGVAAAQSDDECSIIGSWIAFQYDEELEADVASWTSTANGKDESSGTNNFEAPADYDLTLGGQFEDAQKVSVLRGLWERLDDRTFATSMIGIVVDSVGTTLYTVKFTGTNALDEGCDSMNVEGALEFFLAGVNPLTDDPSVGPVPVEPTTAYRIALD